MENDNSDLEKLDIAFPYLHDRGKFNLSNCITPDIEFIENGLTIPAVDKIASLLTKNGYATISDNPYPEYFAELTDKGRDAKAAGGHFAYLKKVADKEHQEKESSKYDLLQKKFIYKARYTPHVFSFLAFIGTVVSLIISYKALYKSDPLLTPQTTDTTQHKPKNEILLQADTTLKTKDTLRNQ